MLKKKQLEEMTDILEVTESLTFVEISCSTSSRVNKPFLVEYLHLIATYTLDTARSPIWPSQATEKH